MQNNSEERLKKIRRSFQSPTINSLYCKLGRNILRRNNNTSRSRIKTLLNKDNPLMHSSERTMSESHTKLPYIPIKDKLNHVFKDKKLVELAKKLWNNSSIEQEKIQKLYYGSVKRFIEKYNVVLYSINSKID